ncbi:MAG: cytochrome c [Rhodospirillales bacterium]|nr:cytochrome c [Rhodospirillales bacterium]
MSTSIPASRLGPILALVLLTSLPLHTTLAQKAPDIQAREQLMKDLGKAVKSVAPMFKDRAPYDADAVRGAATAIETLGGKELTALFPEGSLNAESEALPAIWEDWEDFARLAEDLVLYGRALSAAAGNPRTAAEAPAAGAILGDLAAAEPPSDPATLAALSPNISFEALLKTCGSCHTRFRKKDEK